jgi:hypothetical protein
MITVTLSAAGRGAGDDQRVGAAITGQAVIDE